MNFYKVDKNVPFPTEEKLYPFGKMEIGDSFCLGPEVEEVSENAFRKSVSEAAQRLGHMYKVIKTSEGVRCWRTA